jgi:hypothetical protein
MEKMQIVTKDDLFTLEGIKPTDILIDIYENGMGIIRFGEKLAINLEQFISYSYVDAD